MIYHFGILTPNENIDAENEHSVFSYSVVLLLTLNDLVSAGEYKSTVLEVLACLDLPASWGVFMLKNWKALIPLQKAGSF